MKFRYEKGVRNNQILLYYREDEYSFGSHPFPEDCVTSILIGTLQLDVSECGKLMCVFGYCPLIKYRETCEYPIDYTSHDLFAILPEAPIPGICIGLKEINEWPLYVNRKVGWVCLGDPQTNDRTLIEFAPECVAALNSESELAAVWLHPKVIGKPPPNVKSAFTE